MGENETANFDRIFFFHRASIDYVFWKWETKNNLTKAGDLKITPGYAVTICGKGKPQIPPRTRLYMNTALYPAKKPNGSLYTGVDVTDVNHRLHYQNQPGSLDHSINHGPVLGQQQQAPMTNYVISGKIDRAQYAGSFVVRTYAKGPGHPQEVEIGRDPILSALERPELRQLPKFAQRAIICALG